MVNPNRISVMVVRNCMFKHFEIHSYQVGLHLFQMQGGER